MAGDVDRYLKLVQHDLDALGFLSRGAEASSPPTDVTDWKVTFLFYITCIYVKALGRTRSIDFQDHYQVKQWLNTTPDLLPMTRSYRKLEERSRDARYEGRIFTPTEMAAALRWFDDVRDLVVGLLKTAGVANVPRVAPSPWL